jgi:hypothetical protein
MPDRFLEVRSQVAAAALPGWPRAAFALLCLALQASAGAAELATASTPADRSHGGGTTPFSLSSISAPAYWLSVDSDLPVSRDSLDSRWPSVVHQPDSRPDYSLSGNSGPSAWGGEGRGSGWVELNPTHLLSYDPQRDYRPQFSLGGASPGLRTFLRSAGLDASTCMAPVMRMHSTMSGVGPHTNVSVSARCSFH